MPEGYSFVEDQESVPATGLRVATGLGTTALKNIVDFPGNVAQTIVGAGKLAEKGLGKLRESMGLPELLGKEYETPDVKIPQASKYTVNPLVDALLPKDYTEPRGEGEKLAHETVGDLTTLLMPLPGIKGLSAGKALAASGLGNIAGWLAKDLGGSEGTQTGVKLGTMLATSLENPFKLNNYKKQLYETVESSIPETAQVSSEAMDPIFKDIDTILKRGHMTPNKQSLASITETVKSKIKDGQLPVVEAWELKKNMNELFGDYKSLKGVEKLATRLTGGLNEVINKYGTKDPKIIGMLREADSIHKGMNKASAINAYLQRRIDEKHLGLATAGLLFGHSMVAGFPLAHTLGAVGGAMALRGMVQGAEALYNSPAIRKYYANIMKAATQENVGALAKNVAELDREMSKKYPERMDSPAPTEGFSFVE